MVLMSSTPSFRWYALVCAGMWWHASFSVTDLEAIDKIAVTNIHANDIFSPVTTFQVPNLDLD